MKLAQKQLLRNIILLAILLATPIVLMFIINLPPHQYITKEEITQINTKMTKFSLDHCNSNSGIFIDPEIEANYWIVQSLATPAPSSNISFDFNTIFRFYLWDKQNKDGGFSDAGGFGTLQSSYHVIRSLKTLDSQFFFEINGSAKMQNLRSFIRMCLAPNSSGFIAYPSDNLTADIASTFYALALVDMIQPDLLSKNEKQNISQFLDTCWRIVGAYARTPKVITPELESTYFGVFSRQYLKEPISSINISAIETYVHTCFNPVDKGYSFESGGVSHIVATIYAYYIFRNLGLTIPYPAENADFVRKCQKMDGGFGFHFYQNISTTSEIKFGACAMILLNYTSKSLSDSNGILYKNWLMQQCGSNSLFGSATVESNYFGLLAASKGNPNLPFDQLPPINPRNIAQFVNACYNEDGGYGEKPGYSSSLGGTYYALQCLRILNVSAPYSRNTSEYIENFYNRDGGYRFTENATDFSAYTGLGSTMEFMESYYGPYASMFNVSLLLLLNSSTSIATHWALSSLSYLNRLNETRVVNSTKWCLSSQNVDGGFGLIVGVISDVVSCYYTYETLKLLGKVPLSPVALLEFLQHAQFRDGGFYITSMAMQLGEMDTPSYSYITFFACSVIYDMKTQPANIKGLQTYFYSTLDGNTNGFGDYPYFGGDLSNQAYGLYILDRISMDRSFNPEPWMQLLSIILIGVLYFILGFTIISLLRYFGMAHSFNLRKKNDLDYLKNFLAIDVSNLSVFAGGKKILSNCAMKLKHGEILGVLGESGAGKSTFVKAILGMREFTGSNKIYGMDIANKANEKILRSLYGYVPQDLSKIYDNFTVMENIITFGSQYGMNQDLIVLRGRKILKSLGILEKEDQLVSTLSGGQKRRVSIAIALIHNPIMCVLDEPTSGLDPVVRQTLWQSLVELNERLSTTLIVITHYPEESRYCHKVAIFGRGRGLVDYGSASELLSILPGHGRAIELQLRTTSPGALTFLRQIDPDTTILEVKNEEFFLIFSDLSMKKIREKITDKTSPLAQKIKDMKQVDAQMEHFFRFRFLEVKHE